MIGFIGETVGKIFGTDKAVNKIIDQTANAIDKLVYTEEEKAIDKSKNISEARSMVIK
jgi:hypothetical protein